MNFQEEVDMLFSIWKRWVTEMPSFHPLILQLFFSLVLVFTLSRAIRGWRPDRMLATYTFEWAALCWSTLLLTTALSSPLGAGFISLSLETWRRKSSGRFSPLDGTVATWAIILGLLIAENQYRVALAGTLVPVGALWIFSRFEWDKNQSEQYLMRLTMDTRYQNPGSLMVRIRDTSPLPFQPVYQTENGTQLTYALAFQTPWQQFEAFTNQLRSELPDIELDWQSVQLANRLPGGSL